MTILKAVKISTYLIGALHLFLIYVLISSGHWCSLMGYATGLSFGIAIGCVLTINLLGFDE